MEQHEAVRQPAPGGIWFRHRITAGTEPAITQGGCVSVFVYRHLLRAGIWERDAQQKPGSKLFFPLPQPFHLSLCYSKAVWKLNIRQTRNILGTTFCLKKKKKQRQKKMAPKKGLFGGEISLKQRFLTLYVPTIAIWWFLELSTVCRSDIKME